MTSNAKPVTYDRRALQVFNQHLAELGAYLLKFG